MNNPLDSINDLANAKEILSRIRATKINVLLIGGTGVGKSSTINALFQNYGDGQDTSVKVGKTSSPETMDVSSHELDNLVIWDTPGLGDSTTKDAEHKDKITSILMKKDSRGLPLVDLVFLVLDAGSRDFGSVYTLIKDVVLPNLQGDDRNRLLIGLNQADQAMKSRYWDKQENKPEPQLVKFLDEQVQTVKNRIKKETGLEVEPVYYSAGYTDGNEPQRPYNLQKLLSYILARLPEKKRAAVADHINPDQKNFQSNDDKKDYGKEVETSIFDSIATYAKEVFTEAYDKAKKFVTDPEVVKAGSNLLAGAVLVLLKAFANKNSKK